ncbi:MAG: DUF1214 domain-containing protein [Sphingomonadaceae bacterium]
MRDWARYLICGVIGVGLGTALALHHIRTGLGAGSITNGPWRTAKTYGTLSADTLTRAQVALGGLLALPAKEAMYFTARADSKGQPLEGRCTYEVKGLVFKDGGGLDARWWSITLYDPAGYLVANPEQRYSIGSGSIGPVTLTPTSTWSFTIAPKPTGALQWISTGGVPRFELTLRAYHPGPALLTNPDKVLLPTITREGCV